MPKTPIFKPEVLYNTLVLRFFRGIFPRLLSLSLFSEFPLQNSTSDLVLIVNHRFTSFSHLHTSVSSAARLTDNIYDMHLVCITKHLSMGRVPFSVVRGHCDRPTGRATASGVVTGSTLSSSPAASTSPSLSQHLSNQKNGGLRMAGPSSSTRCHVTQRCERRAAESGFEASTHRRHTTRRHN